MDDNNHQKDLTSKSAIADSEINYRSIFDDALDMIHLVSADGLIIDANKIELKKMGYSRAEYIGKMLKDLIHPDCLEVTMEACGKVFKGESLLEHETIMISRDGTAIPVEVNAYPHIVNGKVVYIRSILRDISRRKGMMESLRNSKERFSKAFQAHPDIILLTRLSDGQIMDANEALETVSGWAVDEAIGKTTIGLGCFQNPSDRMQMIKAIENDGYIRDMNLDLRTRSGEDRLAILSAETVEIDGEACLVTVIRDVTEARANEKELEKYRRELKAQVDERTRQVVQQAQIIDQVQNAVISTDLDANITSWNKGAAKMFGYSAEEVLGTSAFRLHAKSERDHLQASVVNPLKQKGSYAAEFLMEHKNGDVFNAHLSLSMLKSEADEPVGMIGNILDISDRVETEHKLQLSEERFRSIFESMQDAYIQTSLEGKIILANQAALKLTGYESMNELLQKDMAEDIHADPEQRHQILGLLQQNGHLTDYEMAIKRKDGSILTGEASIRLRFGIDGAPTGIEGTFRDITKRKQAEQKIRENEAKYHTLFELSNDANMMLSEAGFIECNQAALDMFSCTDKKQFLNLKPDELSPPYQIGGAESGVTMAEYVATAHREGKAFFEWTLRRVNGEEFPAAILLTPMKLDGNDVIQMIVRDITIRKQTEQSLIEARDAAEKANNAKSQFLSSMSHELRTPLNAILGFAQLLELEETMTNQQRENINEILDAGSHLLLLINELLDLAKIESGQVTLIIEPVELLRVIEDSIALVSTLADNKNIRINCSGLKDVVVLADNIRLKQVMLNLLSNAIKYNREGGSVEIKVQRKADDRVNISIKDTGSGIRKEYLADLFQPFQRLEAEHSHIEGTGIGLSLTKNIVEMMDGSIGVKSTMGEGSTFWIEFNLA